MPYFEAVKAVFAALILALVAAVAPGDALPAPGQSDAVVHWLASLGDRREGSAEEDQVFRALDQWFGGRASMESVPFSLPGEASFSHRVTLTIPGAGRGEIVVVVPTDGANNAGLACATAWADRAITSGTPLTLRFLFTGAERAESRGMGSRDFLQDYFPPVPAAALYLDLVDSPTVRLVAESGSTPSPLWMVRGLVRALSARQIPVEMAGPLPSIFRLDLPERTTPLAPWLSRSIPAVMIAAGPSTAGLVSACQSFVASLSAAVPERWDRHWLAFAVGRSLLFLDQAEYITILLAFSSVLLGAYAIRGRSRRSQLSILTKDLWQLPALFSVLMLSFALGTLAVDAVQALRHDPTLWMTAPRAVAAFKMLVTLSVYFSVFIPFRKSPLSREPAFYAQAALAWMIVLFLGALVLELSFSFYFLWALVWGLITVLVPWKAGKALALLIAPLWLVGAITQILGPHPDPSLAHGLLLSPIAGSVTLAGLVGPFLLLVHHWYYTQKHLQDRNETLRAVILIVLGSGAATLTGFHLLNLPARPPAAASRADFDLDTRPRPELLSVSSSRTQFLGRTTWHLVFYGKGPLETLNLQLSSGEPLTLYESTFPAVLDPAGTSATIVIGRQPPLPLDLTLTLPSETRAVLAVHAHWEFPSRQGADLHVRLEP